MPDCSKFSLHHLGASSPSPSSFPRTRRDEATGADIALIPVAIELAHPDTHKENPGLPRRWVGRGLSESGGGGRVRWCRNLVAKQLTAFPSPVAPFFSAGLVYARNVLTKDPGTLAVWRLAKAVHKSLDSAFHQVSGSGDVGVYMCSVRVRVLQQESGCSTRYTAPSTR